MPSNDVYRLECCQLAVQIWSRQWKQIESGTLKIEVQIELPSDTWESPNIGQHSVDLIIRMPTNQDSLNESFELNVESNGDFQLPASIQDFQHAVSEVPDTWSSDSFLTTPNQTKLLFWN